MTSALRVMAEHRPIFNIRSKCHRYNPESQRKNQQAET
jgi:hypothetical protein